MEYPWETLIQLHPNQFSIIILAGVLILFIYSSTHILIPDRLQLWRIVHQSLGEGFQALHSTQSYRHSFNFFCQIFLHPFQLLFIQEGWARKIWGLFQRLSPIGFLFSLFESFGYSVLLDWKGWFDGRLFMLLHLLQYLKLVFNNTMRLFEIFAARFSWGSMRLIKEWSSVILRTNDTASQKWRWRFLEPWSKWPIG